MADLFKAVAWKAEKLGLSRAMSAVMANGTSLRVLDV